MTYVKVLNTLIDSQSEFNEDQSPVLSGRYAKQLNAIIQSERRECFKHLFSILQTKATSILVQNQICEILAYNLRRNRHLRIRQQIQEFVYKLTKAKTQYFKRIHLRIIEILLNVNLEVRLDHSNDCRISQRNFLSNHYESLLMMFEDTALCNLHERMVKYVFPQVLKLISGQSSFFEKFT